MTLRYCYLDEENKPPINLSATHKIIYTGYILWKDYTKGIPLKVHHSSMLLLMEEPIEVDQFVTSGVA